MDAFYVVKGSVMNEFDSYFCNSLSDKAVERKYHIWPGRQYTYILWDMNVLLRRTNNIFLHFPSCSFYLLSILLPFCFLIIFLIEKFCFTFYVKTDTF